MAKKQINIVNIYQNSNPEERFSFMMSRFDVIEREITKAEKIVTYKIKIEQEKAKSRLKDELGVRVKTSKIADQTADNAINNIMIEKAIKTGEIDKAILKGISNSSEIVDEIKMLRIIKMDYELLVEMVEGLPETDSRMIKKRFVEKKYYKEIADDEKKKYETVKKRIERIYQKLKEETVIYLEMNI